MCGEGGGGQKIAISRYLISVRSLRWWELWLEVSIRPAPILGAAGLVPSSLQKANTFKAFSYVKEERSHAVAIVRCMSYCAKRLFVYMRTCS